MFARPGEGAIAKSGRGINGDFFSSCCELAAPKGSRMGCAAKEPKVEVHAWWRALGDR